MQAIHLAATGASAAEALSMCWPGAAVAPVHADDLFRVGDFEFAAALGLFLLARFEIAPDHTWSSISIQQRLYIDSDIVQVRVHPSWQEVADPDLAQRLHLHRCVASTSCHRQTHMVSKTCLIGLVSAIGLMLQCMSKRICHLFLTCTSHPSFRMLRGHGLTSTTHAPLNHLCGRVQAHILRSKRSMQGASLMQVSSFSIPDVSKWQA